MITFRKLEKVVVGSINGKPFNLPKTEDIIKRLTGLQANFTPEAVEDFWTFAKFARNISIAGSNEYLTFKPTTGEYYLTYDGKVSTTPIPQTLVEFIEESYDKDIDFMPVVKAWANLLSNPRCNREMVELFESYLSTDFVDEDEAQAMSEEQEIDIEEARAMCTYQDIAITQEGLLATYKVAEEVTWKYEIVEDENGNFVKKKNDRYNKIPAVIDDVTGEVIEPEKFEKPPHKEDMVFTPAICKSGDKFFSGDKIGYVYEIGKVQYLPVDAKRNLDNTFGGGGLYIGGLHYIRGYRSSGTHVLTCFVNPRDILSFQCNGQAIRVDALMPYDVWDEDIPLKGAYHSSEYGKVSHERIDALVEEAVSKGYDTLVDYQKELADIKVEGATVITGDDFDIDDEG